MKKKVVTMVLYILMLTIICLSLEYIPYNLRSNSVYYAKNMPRGEGQYPEIIMLVDNLECVYKPDIEGIKYDIDGTNAILNMKSDERWVNIYDEETIYRYKSKDDISYLFNKKMEIIWSMDYKVEKEIDILQIDKSSVVSDIDLFLSPIIEAQPKPKVNLQWLFNFIYADDFK